MEGHCSYDETGTMPFGFGFAGIKTQLHKNG